LRWGRLGSFQKTEKRKGEGPRRGMKGLRGTSNVDKKTGKVFVLRKETRGLPHCKPGNK